MAEVKLVAEPGRPCGSRESRRLRANGRVPGVIYGHGVQGLAVSVDGRELRHALSGGVGTNQLLELQVGSESHLAMAKVIQRHPVRHTVLHVDFLIVRRDEVVTADVPVVVVGEAKEVEREQGLVEQQLATLTVRATPGRIPPHLEVDVSGLTVGDSIRVADLELPSGVSTELPPDEVVVIASLSRAAAALEEAEAEAAAGEEAAAEGEPAAGTTSGESTSVQAEG
ncbi:MAG TPA: 50S ribosomal protein L25 [Acidimicrobiales bacterium]|nr:50S ribosomal protein L25 [Acidimicrobiales bacterium]